MSSHTDPTSNSKQSPLNQDSWIEAVAAFEDHLYRRGQSDATIATYASCLTSFADFYRHQLNKPGPYVARLQESDLSAFIDFLRHERHLAAPSVNRYIAALRSFLKFSFAKGWHRRLLATEIKGSRIKPRLDMPRLSKAEVRRLIAAVDLNGRNGHRNLAIIQLFLQCGLRVGELVHLSRDDVTLHKTTGSVRVRDGNGKNERMIPLNHAGRRAILNYLDTRGPMAGHDPLFISERQLRVRIAAVQHMIKRHLCKIGREELSTQDLRHYFALELYARSGKLRVTQHLLGHRDINTTARYAKATDAELQEAINALED